MGDSLQNLLADVRFPHKPSNVHYLKNFDSPVNNGTAYAQRLKGYFIAPESGQYKFYSSCDDECEVFLGLDGKEGENNKIIGQKRASLHNEFDRYVRFHMYLTSDHKLPISEHCLYLLIKRYCDPLNEIKEVHWRGNRCPYFQNETIQH